ncbi:MAG: hypothetical protein AB8B91_01795 [Rubripirellula sp.]
MDQPAFDASNEPGNSNDSNSAGRESRPFLGIRFKCCRTYGRIYRDPAKAAYVGNCPKCRARISVPIGSGGTSTRFFNAG